MVQDFVGMWSDVVLPIISPYDGDRKSTHSKMANFVRPSWRIPPSLVNVEVQEFLAPDQASNKMKVPEPEAVPPPPQVLVGETQWILGVQLRRRHEVMVRAYRCVVLFIDVYGSLVLFIGVYRSVVPYVDVCRCRWFVIVSPTSAFIDVDPSFPSRERFHSGFIDAYPIKNLYVVRRFPSLPCLIIGG